MNRSGYYIVLMLLLALSCKKKEYPKSTEENSPVFITKATINGEEIDFTAGQNGYQVFSSYSQDTNNIYNFIAEVKKNDCDANCPRSLKIQINDYKALLPGQSPVIDSSLKKGTYDYLKDQGGPSYTVKFPAEYNRTAASYAWDFSQGAPSSEVQPSFTFKKAGSYNVCLVVQGSNGCMASVCHVVNVGPSKPLNAFIIQTGASGNRVSFARKVQGGKTPYKYTWSFGDGTFSTDSVPTHTYAITGSYPVELTVIDAAGTKLVTKYNYVSKNDYSSCAANFSPEINQLPYAYALSKIVISWTDVNGKKYTSNNDMQPATSFFEILSVENYENNELGQATKKLKVRFKCNVYSNSESLAIDNAEALISVGYK